MTDFLQVMFHYIQTFNISIWDVADIAIVAYVIYRILILVRCSRTAQVAKAILLLLIALALAAWLPLRVVYFVLSNLLTMGALALIVVFQPEIRRFLEQLGSSSLEICSAGRRPRRRWRRPSPRLSRPMPPSPRIRWGP